MLDTGNTGFMLVAAALVLFMTPGLAFFYGGLVGKKNLVSILFQVFVSMGVSTILWWAVGYTLSFSGDGAIIGNLDNAFLNGIDVNAVNEVTGVPIVVFIAYQMMFAIITPALITGAFTNRMKFGPYLVFLVVWQLFVYFPFVHMIWGGGALADWGVLDFAGGVVVHNTAGMGALASILFLGKRKNPESAPHSIPMVALGTAMLWFGWYGFNAGSALEVSSITAVAFLNTHIAAAVASMTWLFVEWRLRGKPSLVGLLTGAIAGLATITPAAGFVSFSSAALIGVAAGLVCMSAVEFLNHLGWDDALDVWGVHGVGGLIGTVLLGVLGSVAVNPAGADGLIHGGSGFFGKQLAAIGISSVWAFVLSYAMLWLINMVMPMRTSEADQNDLDESLFDETAYQPIG